MSKSRVWTFRKVMGNVWPKLLKPFIIEVTKAYYRLPTELTLRMNSTQR
jgi:hypothetical protein